MAEPKRNTSAEQDIFQKKVLPIMERVQKELRQKQVEEYGRHCNSWQSILASAAGPDGGMAASAAYNDTIYITGKWNSKTVEDYIDMVKAELKKNNIQVDAVLEKKMIDHLIQQKMPKSTAEYILRKAAEGTLFYIPQRVRTSPLQDHINKEGERLHNPSFWEEVTADVLAWGGNAATTMGAGGFFGQLAMDGAVMATDAVAPGQEDKYKDQQRQKARQEVATANKRVVSVPLWMLQQMGFTSIDKATDKQLKVALDWATKNAASQRKAVETAIEKGERVIKFGSKVKSVSDATTSAKQYETFAANIRREINNRQERIRNPPIAEAEEHPIRQQSTSSMSEPTGGQQSTDSVQSASMANQQNQGDYSGWNNLLGSMGLEGIDDTVNHLGVTLAMLPEMLLGIFTGRTKSIGMNKSTMLPLAAILSGSFIRNPFLKIPLMLWGGANLVNKMGQEAMKEYRHDVGNAQQAGVQFRKYEDEPLNERIKNPRIEGNVIVMDIDNVPRVVTLPNTTAAAYQSGALPLNTLANAILAKSDMMSNAQANFNQEQDVSRRFEQKQEREQVRGIR